MLLRKDLPCEVSTSTEPPRRNTISALNGCPKTAPLLQSLLVTVASQTPSMTSASLADCATAPPPPQAWINNVVATAVTLTSAAVLSDVNLSMVPLRRMNVETAASCDRQSFRKALCLQRRSSTEGSDIAAWGPTV